MDAKILVGNKVFTVYQTAMLRIERANIQIAETQYCAEVERYERIRRAYTC